jgi:hypothetical protein
MEYEDFRNKLRELNISMKEFSVLIKTSYGTVRKWGKDGRAVPTWVESWLNLYIQNQNLQESSISEDEYKEYKELIQLRELITNVVQKGIQAS